MTAEIKNQMRQILAAHDLARPGITADALRELWLQFEPSLPYTF